ncbi:photosystem reaction center subunit H [Altericista sp. CCNU0014]|uniref:photosystem reaction center subunit H n=1 Tax=Altericista sp. CCNU0014 TaxID=3082949 RepID=UPI00384F82C8
MLNIIRRSQIVGSRIVDSTTADRLDYLEEVWSDSSGHVTYLSGKEGYLSLAQVSGVGGDAVSVFHRLAIEPSENLRCSYRLPVQSSLGLPLGWVEDFLFDWHTGEISAYILAGDIAAPFGGRAVLFPEDVEAVVAEAIIVREGSEDRLKSESEGLKGFLSEKSRQVQDLVRTMGDRLHNPISPQDKPEVVRVKIKAVSDELATSGHHDRHALQEATDFLHHQWESLQHSISRAGHRAKSALDKAWINLAGKK